MYEVNNKLDQKGQVMPVIFGLMIYSHRDLRHDPWGEGVRPTGDHYTKIIDKDHS
jgi:hypothetical protein